MLLEILELLQCKVPYGESACVNEQKTKQTGECVKAGETLSGRFGEREGSRNLFILHGKLESFPRFVS